MVAPIWGTPAEFLTYPDIEPGLTPADAATHSEATTTSHASIRVIVQNPLSEVPGTKLPRPQPLSAVPNSPNYSTANRTEGAICCFETLSSTFTVNL
jgi:hypothetical protein